MWHTAKKELTVRLVTRHPTDFAVRREWDARQRMSTFAVRREWHGRQTKQE
jgi:hypothetical protein